LVTYGDDTATAFGFSQFKDVHEIDDSIDSVSYMGGDPRTGNALYKVKNGIFNMYSRKNAEHALVLLTSGSSADDITQASAELRNMGVKVIKHIATFSPQSLKTDSKAKEASQGVHIATSNPQSLETDSKAKEASQGVHIATSNPQSLETDSKAKEASQGAHIAPSSKQSLETDSKAKEDNQGAHIAPSSKQSPETDSKAKEDNQGAHIATSSPQSLETDSKAKEVNQGAHIATSSSHSLVTDSKDKEAKEQRSNSLHLSENRIMLLIKMKLVCVSLSKRSLV
jgi:hypothetical protein